MLKILWGILLAAAVSSPAVAGKIGKDERLPIKEYASRHGMDEASARTLFGASGRIMCPFNAASAFLVYRNDIVLTARHVVIPEPSANGYAGYGRPSHCSFELSADGLKSTWYEVDVSKLAYPADKQRSTTDRFDWIALKLVAPIPNVQPYKLYDAVPGADEKVTMVTLRQEGFPHEDWNERLVEDCKVRKTVAIDGVVASGLKTDCSATGGASGGALVRIGKDGPEVVGVMSSTATRDCKKYNSTSCFSFSVGLAADVRKAIVDLAEGK